MRISELSGLYDGMTEKQEQDMRDAINSCKPLQAALVKVLTKKVNAIESKLDDVDELAKMPKALEYTLAMLAVRKAYSDLLNLIN